MQSVKKELLDVSEFNVRKSSFEVEDLIDSIKSVGILEPLIVRPNGNKFEIVIGQRRHCAGLQAGLKEFPCIVKKLTDEECIELSLIENIQTENLDPIDEANAYKRLIALSDRAVSRQTVTKLSNRIGIGESTIWQKLSLLNLKSEIQKKVREQRIDLESASKISNLPNSKQEEVAKVIEDLPREMATKIIQKVKEGIEPLKAKEKVFEEELISIRVSFSSNIKQALYQASKKLKKSTNEIVKQAIVEFLKKGGFL